MMIIDIADKYLSPFPPQNIFVIWDDDFNIDGLFTNVNIFFPFLTFHFSENQWWLLNIIQALKRPRHVSITL